jgi:hypothetical protein
MQDNIRFDEKENEKLLLAKTESLLRLLYSRQTIGKSAARLTSNSGYGNFYIRITRDDTQIMSSMAAVGGVDDDGTNT